VWQVHQSVLESLGLQELNPPPPPPPEDDAMATDDDVIAPLQPSTPQGEVSRLALRWRRFAAIEKINL
jgi:hypothetical protein